MYKVLYIFFFKSSSSKIVIILGCLIGVCKVVCINDSISLVSTLERMVIGDWVVSISVITRCNVFSNRAVVSFNLYVSKGNVANVNSTSTISIFFSSCFLERITEYEN